MTLANLDDISPTYLGEDRIVLTLAPGQAPLAGRPLTLLADYAACEPYGISLPLELIVQGTAPEAYQRRVIAKSAPEALVVTPREGGPHSVVLREMGHNRWWGRISVSVGGDRFESST